MSAAREQISADLRALGVQQGDVVLAKADVRFMRLKREPKQRLDYATELRDGLLEAVGDKGTIVVLAFTQTSVLGPLMRRPPFTTSMAANTGGLANSVLQHERVVRSTHPINSFAAIGPLAQSLMRFHTPYTYSHRLVEDLVGVRSKMLIVGCVDLNPGFSTVHLAQHHLGLTERNMLAGRVRATYRDQSGEVRRFVKRDIPGCSLGFGNLYPAYRDAGILVEGQVARAPSMLISTAEAYEIDLRHVAADPLSVLCDDPFCVDCRVFKTYLPAGRTRSVARILHRKALPYARAALSSIARRNP